MGDWEDIDNIRKGGVQKFNDAVAEEEVVDDWEAEDDADEEPGSKSNAAAKPSAPELKIKSAEELTEKVDRQKKIENMKKETPEERKARVKREQEQAQLKDVADLFGDTSPVRPAAQRNSEEKSQSKGGMGLGDFKLDTVEHFTDLADKVAIRVLSQKGNSQLIRTGRLAFLNNLINHFEVDFTSDELKDLTSRLKALQMSRSKEEKEKAALAAKKKGGKNSTAKKHVRVERADEVIDDDVDYDEDYY